MPSTAARPVSRRGCGARVRVAAVPVLGRRTPAGRLAAVPRPRWAGRATRPASARTERPASDLAVPCRRAGPAPTDPARAEPPRGGRPAGMRPSRELISGETVPGERAPAGVPRRVAKLFFDPQELVVLGDAL